MEESINSFDVIVVGGGAAGFFGALRVKAEAPNATVCLLERGSKFLQKVSISGGGRCNVTHACFEPKQLVKNYPRGHKELIGPFHKWQPGDTLEWFAQRGVDIKEEADGRMFPITDDSQTIIDCLMKEAEELGVELRKRVSITEIVPLEEDGYHLITESGTTFYCKCLLLSLGGLKKDADGTLLKHLKHTRTSSVPSLFTFKIKNPLIEGLQGISMPEAEISLPQIPLKETGPVLITHWGLSGPGVLRLSAWGARELHDMDYQYKVLVNWVQMSRQQVIEKLLSEKKKQSKRKVINHPSDSLPKLPARLWARMCELSGISETLTWANVSRKQIDDLAGYLSESQFHAQGKSTNKDEFVTCGGITLSEVDFRTMESRLHTNLFFAGEVLDIDAITGGFNFQAAWTTSTLAGKAIAERV